MALLMVAGSFKTSVFKELRLRNGKIQEVEYQDPFGRIFVEAKTFEYGGMERETGDEAPSTNQLVEFIYRLGE